MVQKIELLSDAEPDRVYEQVGEQPRELPAQSTLDAENLAPIAVGSSISLASPDAGRIIRLTGFGGLEPDGQWTVGNAATIALRLATHPGKGHLRLYFTPFVTPHAGQSIRVKCGDGKELTRSYPPGLRRETILDLPLSRTTSNGEISISITIDAPNSPASVGLGADERLLGIQLHRVEFVTGFSRSISFARWALRPFIRPVRAFLTRPLVERLTQLDKQMRERDAVSERMFTDQTNALRTELARVTDEGVAKQGTKLAEWARLINEGFVKQGAQVDVVAEWARLINDGLVKQGAQVDVVLRAIEDLPSRSEFVSAVTRLVSLEQTAVRLEQLISALHQKLDIVANRFFFPVDDDTVLVRCFVDYLYCSRKDHAVLANINDGGGFEPGLRRLLERLLEPGMVFLDVGAHLGLHTLAAARRIGKTGRVFCFEPTPVTYELLCRTLRLNGLDDRVTARCAAAGRENTIQPLHVITILRPNSLFPLPNSE